MGLKCSPDIAQSMMGSVLDGTADADVYTDDVGVYSTDWNHHVTLLSTILCHLWENGFTIMSVLSEWAVKDTACLCYWPTPKGPKPWKTKLMPSYRWITPRMPQNCTCPLAVAINTGTYAHILKSLTDHSGLKKCASICCTSNMQMAFNKMHALMVTDARATYLEQNKWLHLYRSIW